MHSSKKMHRVQMFTLQNNNIAYTVATLRTGNVVETWFCLTFYGYVLPENNLHPEFPKMT